MNEYFRVVQSALLHPVLGLFLIIALGLGLGRFQVRGISFGPSGVLFVALLFGHLGYVPPEAVGTVGLVAFLYCVGLSAGPGFFHLLAREGVRLGQVVLVVVASAVVMTVIVTRWAEIPMPLALGVFAGAMTSTPALAAGEEATGMAGAQVCIGYGIAYPLGVIGVVLYVQLVPQLVRWWQRTPAPAESPKEVKLDGIRRALVEVTNPTVFDKQPQQVAAFRRTPCVVSRRLEGERLVPVSSQFEFQPGQHVLLVGHQPELEILTDVLGKPSERAGYIDSDHERRDIVLARRNLAGRTLRELDLLGKHGVIVSRIQRYGASFVPSAETRLQRGDVLTIVGEQSKLQSFGRLAGNRDKLFHESDLISFAAGIAMGLVLGQLPIVLPGGQTFRLGIAGGPLAVGLLLAHFGRIGGVVGYLPRASRLGLMDFGLSLFLATSGATAGASLWSVVRTQGLELFVAATLVTAVPLLVGHLFATWCLKLPTLEIFGAVCGAMTSTPGLAAVTSHTDSDEPMMAYAATYPVSLILLTIVVQWLVGILI